MTLLLSKCCSKFGTIKTRFWANQQSQSQKTVIIINGTKIFTDSLVYQYTSICCERESVKATQSCLTLCNPMDYTVQGILQARILEWVAFPFFRGSYQPRDWTQVSWIEGGFFTSWATICCIENEYFSWLRIHKRKYTRVPGGDSKNMPKFLEQR